MNTKNTSSDSKNKTRFDTNLPTFTNMFINSNGFTSKYFVYP